MPVVTAPPADQVLSKPLGDPPTVKPTRDLNEPAKKPTATNP
ncbi:hypothetical protein N5079_06325 [Planotetraspora sp. A-T 1434]|nr:hypothetical protein [Planotetraspora sp. A-T 1434]MCT9929833.1 hypothetical protein [Planotetraspora sp. A-T 1434]